jgi:hypothetical protein
VEMKPIPMQIFQMIKSETLLFCLSRNHFFYYYRRRKLLYELNSTGKYFAFKEQLKHSVIKIVREKFLRTSKFNNPDELQVKKRNSFFD